MVGKVCIVIKISIFTACVLKIVSSFDTERLIILYFRKEAYLHSLLKEPLQPQNENPVHKYGIYSITGRPKTSFLSNLKSTHVVQDNVSGIMHCVDGITLDDHASTSTTKYTTLTQGDKLNQIKAKRKRLPTNHTSLNTTTRPSTVVK